MGNQDLVTQKLKKVISEIETHIQRVEIAFENLNKHNIIFPLQDDIYDILEDDVLLAFADQIIYRFSKAQDTIGAKLFKAFLLYEGEEVNKPFRDILDRFEAMNIIDVDEWFELREIRNEIAHDYDNNEERAKDILNLIYENKKEIKKLVLRIKSFIKE